MILNTYELSVLNLSCATSMFVVDCCQFGAIWMFGLKMELMACAGLVRGTMEQSCIFPDLIYKYQWHEILPKFLHHTSAVPHQFLLLIAANLAEYGCLGWKWSLWHVPARLEVKCSKYVFFLTLYDSIFDMKQLLNFCITPQPCHIHFCFWFLTIRL